ncbi:interleukin-17 receptor E isoform X7 [Homo sapiens]|uniref:interleukin-17 receptor E isoform X7 n=1 Tax=Homo sapiens TaxID=9606 RepID=UPI0005D03DC2|nr:interleukin-17 receptor E isoform X7 [Homo sapiens]|eukprot:XP_011531664.1 interleukin-17 receptor E isoform X5 [Homo sapiens]
MGSSRLAALLLPLLLIVIDLSDSAGIGFRHLPHWNTRCPLASHTDDSFTGSSAYIPCRTWWALFSTKPWCVRVWHCSRCLCQHLLSGGSGLQRGLFHLLVQKSKKSSTFKFYRRHKMPAPAQRKLLPRRHLSEKSHHISIPSPDISHKGLRSKRTQPSDPETWESLPRLDSQRHGGPEFSFDLLPEARAIRVTISSGPEVSVRLCHQWALECEELSSPYDVQKIVSGGHTVELPYEFLLPCLCIEASYLQEDTVRRKKCPFQSWPEAYGSDFWKSVHFTDYSQHTQMVMALTLRCPLKLEAALCQRHDWHTLCKDLPNATARESDGWYVLEKVDLHPQLCFKFSFGNSSHVECPHQTGPGLKPSVTRPHHSLPEARVLCPGVAVRCPVCLEAPLVSGCLLQTPGALDPGTAGPPHPTGCCSGPHLPAPTVRPGPSAASAPPARGGLGGAAAPGGSAG